MKKSDKVYVQHILDAIEKIEKFSDGVSVDDFLNLNEKQSAIIMQLSIIGEMVKRISEENKGKVELPWRDIAGFRDRIVHDYFNIDLDVVWETCQNDLFELKEKIVFLLNSLD